MVPTVTGDKALESLCLSCNTVADELLAALNKLKAKGKHQKWESIRKAIGSIRSKEDIEQLERRLSILREEINLRIVVNLRYSRFRIVPGDPNKPCNREQVSRSNLEQTCRLDQLDSKITNILDAIMRRQDVFSAVEDIQLTLRTVRQQQEELASFAAQEQCLSKLPHIPQAAFNSFDKQHDPICFPGTRTDLLKEIMVWAD